MSFKIDFPDALWKVNDELSEVISVDVFLSLKVGLEKKGRAKEKELQTPF